MSGDPPIERRRFRGAVRGLTHSSVLLAVVSGCAGPAKVQWPYPGIVARRASPDEHDSQPRPSAEANGPLQTASDVPARSRSDHRLTRVATTTEAPPALPSPKPANAAPPSASTEYRTSADLTPSVPSADHGEYPIDLTTALRLAEVENPTIAEARVRIAESLAVQQEARSLLLPSLNAGTNYHGHVGNLQRSSGRILNLSEQSLYVGGGAMAMAAGPAAVPAVSIVSPITDAIFRPLEARQQVAAARFSASATANRVLLEVAELHFELIAARAELDLLRETARQAAEVARLTSAYAEAKQGRSADARRASTELRLIEFEVRKAEETVAVTSTRLVRRLHLDPTVRLQPVAPGLEPVTLIDPEAPLPGMVEAAQRQRPDVAARDAEVSAAEVRQRQEQYRPFLPTLAVGFSGGVFGGGSNLVSPNFGNFRGRTDFDVLLFWTLQNFGAGNVAQIRRRRAELGQAVAERSRVLAEARAEVAAAAAKASAARRQIDITEEQLRSAEKGFSEDLERIRNVVGRPVEVINSLNLLNDARLARVRAVTEYNKAQVRLFVALGSPPPLGSSAADPLPPAPIASPPVSPSGPADIARH